MNNICLTENLTYVLSAYRTCNLTVRFLKYIVIFILLNKIIVLDHS